MGRRSTPAPAADPSEAGRIINGPKPKHAQLREILRRLTTEELEPGSLIPSERELAERYRVSRLTVRSAIGQLVADGLLTRVPGKGTFTTHRRMELQLYLMSFTDDMRRRGLHPATEVIAFESEVPPSANARALGLQPGDAAYRLVRLRRADGTPLAVERGWYASRRLPGLLDHDLNRSLYTLLAEQYGLLLDHGNQTVWAEAADTETARLLGVRPGSPLLVFRRVSTAGGEPVEDMTSWYRGDLYQVTMQLDRNIPDFGPYPSQGGTR